MRIHSRRSFHRSTSGRGFTLIELLVVIAIIGVMTAIIMANLAASRGKARDAKRISDVSQIQLALEQYFDRCRSYPHTLDTGNSTNDCSSRAGVQLGSYISVIPKPPTGGNSTQTTYDYDVSSTYTDYIIHAVLEYPNEAVKDALPSSWSSKFTCSNSQNSLNYCVGPK